MTLLFPEQIEPPPSKRSRLQGIITQLEALKKNTNNGYQRATLELIIEHVQLDLEEETSG